MKNSYVTALTESIIAGESVDEVLASLRKVMEKKGHLRLWSQVLKASARVLASKLRSNAPQVVLATDAGVSEERILKALKALGSEEKNYQKTIDSTLVGGFTARVKDTFYDASHKRLLVDLYRKITN